MDGGEASRCRHWVITPLQEQVGLRQRNDGDFSFSDVLGERLNLLNGKHSEAYAVTCGGQNARVTRVSNDIIDCQR
jgi:hypothetical protein